MSKQLKDILKQAHDRIKGVHTSQTSAASTGKDAGVDYKPKAGDEDEFIAKHSVQRWDDPAGNKNPADGVKYSLDTPQNARMGNKQDEAEKAYFAPVKEAKEAEEAQCNHSAKGKECPVHGMAECWSAKPIKEDEIDEAISKRMKNAGGISRQNLFKKLHSDRSSGKSYNYHGKEEKKKLEDQEKAMAEYKGGVKKLPPGKAKGIKEEVEQVDEVLTKKTTAGETIHDFVHSKNPKFAGKSKEKRKQMALAAYYAKQNEETILEYEAVEPLLGSADIAKNKTDDTGAEIDMVRTEMKAIANKVMHLLANMPADHHIEPWVQAKIAAAKEMIGSVHDYMMYSEPQENEQMDTPMTFPNMSVDVNTGQNV